MTNPDTSTSPESPMASLLFQAPAFQAPTFREPEPSPRTTTSDEDDTPSPRRRRAASREDTVEGEETPAPRRRRSSKRATAGAEDGDGQETGAVEDEPTSSKRRTRRRKADSEDPAGATPSPSPEGSEDTPDSEEQAPKRRQRRSSRSRTAAQQDDVPAAEESGSRDEGAEGSQADSSDARDGHDEEGEEGAGSRRRRRRRSRSSESRGSEDPSDQVTALKGSTRLEAKKQRRREGRKEGRRRHVISESEFLARREAVDRQMVIRHHNGLDQVALVEDGLLVEHYVTRRTQVSMVGNIYLGRVQNVLPSMEAAFIDIGRGRNAVLYAGEVNWDAVGMEGRPRRIEAALKSGDPVLVQVTKDPIGHKGARLTSQITLAGRYLVFIPNGSMMGISRKLPEKERMRLKKILKKAVPGGSGVIVRTAAEGASEEQLADDIARLTKQWADIESKQKKTKSAPVLLRGEPELAVRVVRDVFNEDFRKLVVQGSETFDTVSEYVQELSPELSDRVEQWVGTEDVFHAFRIDEQLAKGMDRKVWLPSGGTLIVDRTEAMTVIDVNTGKYIGAGGTLEETVTRNNLEAAEEIVRQLRLRDIGGIIIVDFVDMVLESNRDLVLRRLVECLGRDRTRHQVTEITSLGLVQMTRKRVGEGLVEAFSTPCEVCEGRGFIVHHEPVEHTGSADHTGGGHSGRSKQRKPVEEPRRLEDDAERGRTREALSAIAAASGHSKASHEGGPAIRPVAESHPEVVAISTVAEEGVGTAGAEASRTGSEPAGDATSAQDARPSRGRGSRRRRAVSTPAAEPDAIIAHEASGPVASSMPEVEPEIASAPVESLLVAEEEPAELPEVSPSRPRRRRAARASSAQVQDSQVGSANESAEHGDTGSVADADTAGTVKAAPARRRRVARTASSAPVESGGESAGSSTVTAGGEPVAEETAPEKPARRRTASGRSATGTATEETAEVKSEAGASTTRSRRGHRRVASTGAVDPATQRPSAADIELPEPKGAEPEAPTHSVSEIELPERTPAALTAGRRAAALTSRAPAAQLAAGTPESGATGGGASGAASGVDAIALPERTTEERPAARRPRRRRAVTTSVVDPDTAASARAQDTTAGSADARGVDSGTVQSRAVTSGGTVSTQPDADSPKAAVRSVEELRLPGAGAAEAVGEAPRRARRHRRAASTGVVEPGTPEAQA
ncbi:MAG: Rne/Rng family ribonuclease [Propionibacterium sp.]|nr:Rne/Rng family ribonuclease [Propionibacterium sp.]